MQRSLSIFGMVWYEIHEEAERLEHAVSPRVGEETCCKARAEGRLSSWKRVSSRSPADQRILRHSNVAVTQACYIKTASEGAKAAMLKLETALNDTYVTPKQPNSGTKAVM